MTKHRLLKIAASIAVAPFYGVAWCVGLLGRALGAIMNAIVVGVSHGLFGDRHVAD